MKLIFSIVILCFAAAAAQAQEAWQARLDSPVHFYQTTDFGILIAGTERSLYAVDGQTGRQLWRIGTGRINETAVTPVPDTDVILVSRDLGSKSRLRRSTSFGGRIWQSEKVRATSAAGAIDATCAVVLVKIIAGRRR